MAGVPLARAGAEASSEGAREIAGAVEAALCGDGFERLILFADEFDGADEADIVKDLERGGFHPVAEVASQLCGGHADGVCCLFNIWILFEVIAEPFDGAGYPAGAKVGQGIGAVGVGEGFEDHQAEFHEDVLVAYHAADARFLPIAQGFIAKRVDAIDLLAAEGEFDNISGRGDQSTEGIGQVGKVKYCHFRSCTWRGRPAMVVAGACQPQVVAVEDARAIGDDHADMSIEYRKKLPLIAAHQHMLEIVIVAGAVAEIGKHKKEGPVADAGT